MIELLNWIKDNPGPSIAIGIFLIALVGAWRSR